ncbi:MAG: NAD(P)-dependent oxidoreductase [Nitrospirales bacterium]|nr:MAG: NAD(P)-dependent oxidoreductase [Nitrospirales bacterium]
MGKAPGDFKNHSSGLQVNPNPFVEDRTADGVPPRQQEWPGRDSALRPKADHGEDTYCGAGKLHGRKALITGGDSGIGRAIAIVFAREGADVAISYYNEVEDARETQKWIEQAGRRALLMSGDLQDPNHCRQVVKQAVQEFGSLNILVNNAAFHNEQSHFLDITPEQLDRTFRTNFYAYVWMAQAALPHIKEGDVILNTGSVVALKGHEHLVDYAATKAAIHNFTLSLAQIVAAQGIRVNCVAPGPVWTPLIPSTRKEEAVDSFGSNSFWKRPAQPAEIASSFVFLASSDARYYTGEILAPTGQPSTTR